MTATDQLREALRTLEARARELELDKRLEKLADSADHLLREAAVKAGDYAHENRGKVEEVLDRAGATVDQKTEGKYHRTFEKLRTGVLLGVDWVAEQRESAATPEWAAGQRWGREPDAAAAPAAPDPAGASHPAGAGPAAAGAGPASAGPPAPGSSDSEAWVDATDAPPAPGSADSDAWVDATDAPPAPRSAGSEAWVDVTDAPPAPGSADSDATEATDAPPAPRSANSDAWVDATDAPPTDRG